MEKLPKNHALAAVAANTAEAHHFGTPLSRALRHKAAAKTTEESAFTLRPATRPAAIAGERLLGKALAGLGKRAVGHVTREVKTTYETGPDGVRTVKNEVVTRKQNPPDLDAIVFALTNLDGVNWQAKPSSATGAAAGSAAPFADLSEEALHGLLRHFQVDEK